MEPSKVKKMTFTQATVFKTIPRFIETATNDIPLPTQPLVFVWPINKYPGQIKSFNQDVTEVENWI